VCVCVCMFPALLLPDLLVLFLLQASPIMSKITLIYYVLAMHLLFPFFSFRLSFAGLSDHVCNHAHLLCAFGAPLRPTEP